MLASVLIGTVEGTRMLCRCFRFEPKAREEARLYDGIQDFVLVVGIGKKTQALRELAQSYIERGTLCVMTVSAECQGEYDFNKQHVMKRQSYLST